MRQTGNWNSAFRQNLESGNVSGKHSGKENLIESLFLSKLSLKIPSDQKQGRIVLESELKYKTQQSAYTCFFNGRFVSESFKMKPQNLLSEKTDLQQI